ncbi:MAG: hypothetical protein AB1465_04685 [Patescibacteria group bacterium]
MKKREKLDFLIGLIKETADENGEFDLCLFCRKNWQKLGYKSHRALYSVVAAHIYRTRNAIELIPGRKGWYRLKKESLAPAMMLIEKPESDDRDFSEKAERKILFFEKLGRKGIEIFILLDEFCKGENRNRIAEDDLKELLLSELDEFRSDGETREEALERFLKIMIGFSLLELIGKGARGRIFELKRGNYREYYCDIDIITSLIGCKEELAKLKVERKRLKADVSIAEQGQKQVEEIYNSACAEVDLLKSQLEEAERRKKEAEEYLNSAKNALDEANKRISTDNFEDRVRRLGRDIVVLRAVLEMDKIERNAIFKKISGNS